MPRPDRAEASPPVPHTPPRGRARAATGRPTAAAATMAATVLMLAGCSGPTDRERQVVSYCQEAIVDLLAERESLGSSGSEVNIGSVSMLEVSVEETSSTSYDITGEAQPDTMVPDLIGVASFTCTVESHDGVGGQETLSVTDLEVGALNGARL